MKSGSFMIKKDNANSSGTSLALVRLEISY